MNGKKHRREIIRGSPEPSTRDEYCEAATVSAVYTETYTCDIRTDSGKDLLGLPFPGLTQDPEGGGGEIHVPRMGQRIEISHGAGLRPRITGFLPQSIDAIAESTVASLSEFELPPTPVGRSQSSFRGSMPKDVLPGDWYRLGNQSQYIGVMDGGVIALHGAPWANIRIIGGNAADTLDIKGRTTKLRTDFGGVEFRSEEGKSWAEFYGGTDQSLETGPDKQNWTVRGDIGKTDGLVNWYVADRDGQSMHRLNIYPDGRTASFQNGPKDERVNGFYTGTFAGPYLRQVQTSNDQVEVLNGDRVERYTGNLDTQVNQNRIINIYSDDSAIVEGNSYRQCKTLDVQAQGSALATPGDTAITMAAINGSFDIDVAPTISAALPTAQSGFHVNVGLVGTDVEMATANPGLGDIKLNAAARLNLDSILPMTFTTNAVLQQDALGPILMSTQTSMKVDSVGPIAFNTPTTLISASNNVATDPAVLYNELLVYLNKLAIALDTHVHISSVSGITTSTPIPPVFASTLNASALSFMSKKVYLGG